MTGEKKMDHADFLKEMLTDKIAQNQEDFQALQQNIVFLEEILGLLIGILHKHQDEIHPETVLKYLQTTENRYIITHNRFKPFLNARNTLIEHFEHELVQLRQKLPETQSEKTIVAPDEQKSFEGEK